MLVIYSNVIVNISCFIFSRTPEGCEKLDHRESGEEEEDDMFPCLPQSTIREEPGNDSDLDEPVWDFGIRRSDSSKVSHIPLIAE